MPLQLALTAGVALLAGLAVSVRADAPNEPLEERHIPEGATTVVHIDFSHAAGTELGRFVLREIGESDDAEFVHEFTTELGIEFGEDIRGVTIVGAGAAVGASTDGENVSVHAGGDDTVLLLYGSEALGKWDEALAAEEEGGERRMIDGRPVRRIDHDEESWFGLMVPEGDERVWVFAPRVEQVESAAGLIEGRGGSADLDEWPVAGPSEGAFLYVAVRDFGAFEGWEPVSDVARRTQGFALSVGEHEDEAFARVQITVGNEEDAEAIVGVCHGVIGLARLTLGKEEELRPLLDLLGRVRLTTDGLLIDASLTHDAESLLGTLDALDELDPLDEELEELDELDEMDECEEMDEADEGEDEDDEDDEDEDELLVVRGLELAGTGEGGGD